MVRGFSIARVAQQELAEAAREDLHRTHIALLAQSRSSAVREAVARRNDVPFGVQAALSNDDVQEVRAAMAANPRAALSVMNHLAADPHHAVLVALSSNPNVPREIAQSLADHRRADVRHAAIRRLERRDEPAKPTVFDPDSRIPELRDRVLLAQEYAPEPARRTPSEVVSTPAGASLSRLAQHISGRLTVASREAEHVSEPNGLRVAAVS